MTTYIVHNSLDPKQKMHVVVVKYESVICLLANWVCI